MVVALSLDNDEAPEEGNGVAFECAFFDVELREVVNQVKVLFNHVIWFNLLNSLNDILKMFIPQVRRDISQELINRELLIKNTS